MGNVLIAIPSPRDIPECIAAIKALNFDKLWVKYYNESEAYDEIRKYFLEHAEYSHLCVIPDDLIVQNWQISKLLSDNLPVVSGVCMINRGPIYENMMAVSTYHEPQSVKRGERVYRFMLLDEYKRLEKTVVPVTFQGFAPLLAVREVIERIRFRDDRIENNYERGCCIDVMFCHDCLEAGIPLHVDLGVFTDHYFLAGKKGARTYCWGSNKSPYIKLIKAGEAD